MHMSVDGLRWHQVGWARDGIATHMVRPGWCTSGNRGNEREKAENRPGLLWKVWLLLHAGGGLM